MESQAKESTTRQRDKTLKDNPVKICTYKGCGKQHKTKQGWCPDCRAGVPKMKTKERDMVTFHVVYNHIDETGEIVYIGEGTPERAWLWRGSSATRDPKHSQWMFEQMKKRKPESIIKIIESNLTKEEARSKEAELLSRIKTRFNKDQ